MKQTKYDPIKKSKQCKPELIAAFDFETDNLGGTLLMGQYAALDLDGEVQDYGYFVGTPDEILSEIWRVMNYYDSHHWVAHNANYDWRYLLPWLDENGKNLFISLATDTKIMSVECEAVTMRDSFLLYPMSLKKFTKEFAPEYEKKSIDIENFNPENPEHIEYAVNDAIGLAVAVYNFRKKFSEIWGTPAKWTMASSAMKAWQTTIKTPVQPSSRHYENFFRHCYSGGYVAPLFTGPVKNAKTFDLNSCYPAVMKQGIPGGPPSIVRKEDFNLDAPSFWCVDVETPQGLLVPVLPWRGEPCHNNFKSFSNWPLPVKQSRYPKGKFRTVCTSIELKFALSIGYKITPVYGLEFEDLIFPFNDFVTTCETLRTHYKGTATETVVKGTQNSLYGKFGMMRIRRVVCTETELDDNLTGWTPLEALGERYGFIVEENENMICAPHIAAWITAGARIKLFDAIYAGGASEVLYTDTDSITVTPKFDCSKIPQSKRYGDFKLEKEWQTFRAHAPKVYAGLIDGHWYGACKGIPKPDEYIFQKLYNGETVEKEYFTLSSVMKYLTDYEKREAQKVSRKSTDYKKCSGWVINFGKRTDLIEVK